MWRTRRSIIQNHRWTSLFRRTSSTNTQQWINNQSHSQIHRRQHTRSIFKIISSQRHLWRVEPILHRHWWPHPGKSNHRAQKAGKERHMDRPTQLCDYLRKLLHLDLQRNERTVFIPRQARKSKSTELQPGLCQEIDWILSNLQHHQQIQTVAPQKSIYIKTTLVPATDTCTVAEIYTHTLKPTLQVDIKICLSNHCPIHLHHKNIL